MDSGGGKASGEHVIVTTSWDDGDRHDLRLAEMLARHGLKGSFYVTFNEPLDGSRPANVGLDAEQMRALLAMGMEIGSHGMSHRLLTALPGERVPYELCESKRRLEDMSGEKIRSISYPLGYVDAAILAETMVAGYELGRSTMTFRIERQFAPLWMPVSVELFPSTALQTIRRAARYRNAAGLARWVMSGCPTEPFAQARALWRRVQRQGGLFHLYGRSHEIEAFGLWGELDALLGEIAARDDIRPLTNIGVRDALMP